MDDETFREDIALLEARIERLADARERCRKISLVAKIAIAAGAIWTLLTLVTLLPFYPSTFFGSLAAMIGGTVLLGSNKTTWEDTEAALREAEGARATIIGRMELRVVGEEGRTVH
jgi:hypothetical protein